MVSRMPVKNAGTIWGKTTGRNSCARLADAASGGNGVCAAVGSIVRTILTRSKWLHRLRSASDVHDGGFRTRRGGRVPSLSALRVTFEGRSASNLVRFAPPLSQGESCRSVAGRTVNSWRTAEARHRCRAVDRGQGHWRWRQWIVASAPERMGEKRNIGRKALNSPRRMAQPGRSGRQQMSKRRVSMVRQHHRLGQGEALRSMAAPSRFIVSPIAASTSEARKPAVVAGARKSAVLGVFL